MSRARTVIVVLMGAAAVAAVHAQQAQYRTGIHTVPVYATVIDAEGRLVTDLNRDDFLVLDNGLPQDITTFSSDSQPITVVMMLDRSGSVVEQFGLIEDAAAAFVDELQDGDRARIGSFSERIQIDPVAFTSDRDELRRILSSELQSLGPTPLWNATSAAMTAVAGQPGRRVVLVLTDGRDAPLSGRPNVTFGELRGRAETEEVMVYVIGLAGECAAPEEPVGPATRQDVPARSVLATLDQGWEQQGTRRPPGGQRGRGGVRRPGPGRFPIPLPIPGRRLPPRPPVVWEPREPARTGSGVCDPGPDPELRALASVGGGGYFLLTPDDDLAATFARVAEELHRQYLLGFVARVQDGARHRLSVRVRRPGLTVRARESYVAPR